MWKYSLMRFAWARSLELKVSQYVGRLRNRVGSLGGPLLFVTVAVIFTMAVTWGTDVAGAWRKSLLPSIMTDWLAKGYLKTDFFLKPDKQSLSWPTLVVVYGLLVMVGLALKARRTLLIEAFVDHTGANATETNGLHELLMAELARLSGSFQVAEEERAIRLAPDINVPLKAGITADANLESLEAALGGKQEIGLGPLKIPLTPVVKAFAWLMRGPRVRVSIQKHDQETTWVAVLSGGGVQGSWRIVDTRIPTDRDAPGSRGTLGMVEELACTLFTAMALRKSYRWTATRAFSRGLESYREGLPTPRQTTLKLLEAERKFVEALSEDERFVRTYYNLGVVYTEMKRLQAAESAFLRAIALEPRFWEAYYALALNNYQREKFDQTISFCDRTIELKPSKETIAKVLNLKALARRKLAGDGSEPADKGTMGDLRRAVVHSWTALCVSARRGESTLEKTAIARNCLGSLAVAHRDRAALRHGLVHWRAFRKAKTLFRQALSLRIAEADTLREMGKAWELSGNFHVAAKQYRTALRIRPEHLELWARLAVTSSRIGDHVAEDAAWNRFLRLVCVAPKDERACAADFMKACPQATMTLMGRRAAYTMYLLDRLESFRTMVEQGTQKPKEMSARLLGQRKRHGLLRNLEWALLTCAAGRLKILEGRHDRALPFFEESIEVLEKEGFTETINRMGLHGWLAVSLKGHNTTQRALAEADSARRYGSLDPHVGKAYGKAHYELGDYKRAKSAYEDALGWAPNDADLYRSIGVAALQLAADSRDPILRKGVLEEAVEHMEKALELYGSDQPMGKGFAHFWQGMAYIEMLQYEKAIPNLRIAKQLDFEVLQSSYYLGRTYLVSAAYDKADVEFRGVIESAKDHLGKGIKTTGRWSWIPIPTDRLLAEAHLGIAKNAVLRDVGCEEALSRLKSAETIIARELKDSPIRRMCLAEAAAIRGLLCYKNDNLRDAATNLTSALTDYPSSETYLYLALVHERMLERDASTLDAKLCKRRIEEYCRHTDELDMRSEFTERVKALRNRVQSA